VLSALPIVNLANCCCLWIVGGGLLAGHLAGQEGGPLTAMRGAKVGLLAGVVGAGVWLVAALALDVVMAPLQERMLSQVMRNAVDVPPEVRGWLELMNDRASAPVRLAAGFVFQLFAGAVFSTIGGVLAAAFFRRPPVPDTPQGL
jgi:hypothetical protein